MKYKELVALYEELEKTSKRLEMTYLISNFLKKIPTADLEAILLLLQGRVFHKTEENELGVGSKIIVKAIAKATANSEQEVTKTWKHEGDLGKAANQLIKHKKQSALFSKQLSVKKVYDNLRKLPTISGSGSIDKKIGLVVELLTSATPLEATYVVKTVLEELRLGTGEGTLRDAITWAFLCKITYDKDAKKLTLSSDERKEYNDCNKFVQHAIDVTNNLGKVAALAKEKGKKSLKQTQLSVGEPIKVMLYPKAQDIKDAFRIVGKPALFEFKYDGFRVIINRWFSGNKEHIKIFTRRLEDVTGRFPDIVDAVQKLKTKHAVVLDAEAVGFDNKTKTYLPFQNISQRIKRKYNIKEMAKKMPVELNVFDILHFDKETMIDKPLKERRKIMLKIVPTKKWVIRPAQSLITSSIEKAETFYHKALELGEEGVMVKNLDAVYKPGSRVGYGVKVKPVLESIDVVVVGAEWGEGKRKGTLSSYKIAVLDEDGELVELGKVASGVKEKGEGLTYSHMTKLLKPHIISEKGRSVTVHPSIVLEILYSEIQKSPTYTSGFALRFPRVVRLREDKGRDDITLLSEITDFYKQQERIKNK